MDNPEPIVCTLDAKAMRQRLLEFREVLSRGFLGGERLASGVRWRFTNQPGLEMELRDLAAREQGCCPFFRFQISAAGSEIWWDTRVQSGAEPILEEFFRLPQV
jgi:hypothetical protein